MNPVIARTDNGPGPGFLNIDDNVARSAAVRQAAGFQLVPLARPIGPWALLGVSGQGLLLCSVVRDAWPTTLGAIWGHPADWPLSTRRLVHRWETDKTLPDALPLS